MKEILSSRQTIITSWMLALFRWFSIAGYLYFINRAHEFVDPKSGFGDVEKAEPLFQIAGTFFWAWAIIILAAVILSLLCPKIERSMVILFQVIVLPCLELWFIFFYVN